MKPRASHQGAAALVVAALAVGVRGDLPIHCLIQDIVGDWDFFSGDRLGQALPDCGHTEPNTAAVMARLKPSDVVPVPAGKQRVRLHAEKAEVDGRPGLAAEDLQTGERGLWTPVYDEGLEVRFRNVTFTTHFNFRMLDDQKIGKTAGLKWDSIGRYVGVREVPGRQPPNGKVIECRCDATSVGWFTLTPGGGPREHGCFYGRRRPNTLGKANGMADEPASLVLEEGGKFVKLHRSLFRDGRVPLPSDATWEAEVPEVMRLISLVGSSGQRLEAGEMRSLRIAGSLPRPGGAARRPLNATSLVRLGRLPLRRTPARSVLGSVAAGPQYDAPRALVGGSSGDLPTGFDWREELEEISPPGVDDLGEEFDQGPCGSCYAFAATLSFQMRLRIALFREHGLLAPVELSWRGPTKCSPWTEGCRGGFSFLTFKLFKERGAPLYGKPCGDLAPLNDAELETGCDTIPACYRDSPLIFAKDYGYVGGFSQAANEALIMREIYKNGPVVVGFSVAAAPEFRSGRPKSTNRTITRFVPSATKLEPAPNGQIQPWYYASHAVICVGWGENQSADLVEAPVKYWVIRNSWGAGWGSDGYVKMRRGRNDVGLEMLAEWATPDLDRLPEGFLEVQQARSGKKFSGHGF